MPIPYPPKSKIDTLSPLEIKAYARKLDPAKTPEELEIIKEILARRKDLPPRTAEESHTIGWSNKQLIDHPTKKE